MYVEHRHQLRSRYGETDQMGYVYYGNYPEYFEVGRAELCRAAGLPYGDLETLHRVMMPVVEMHIRYRKPARYDNLLTIHTWLDAPPEARIRFHHTIHNEQEELIVSGFVELAFVRMDTLRPTRCPQVLLDALEGLRPRI